MTNSTEITHYVEEGFWKRTLCVECGKAEKERVLAEGGYVIRAHTDKPAEGANCQECFEVAWDGAGWNNGN